MAITNTFAAISLVCLHQSTWGFAPSYTTKHTTSPTSVRPRSHVEWQLNYNPNDVDSFGPDYYTDNVPPFSEYEDEASRKRRMEMVRKIRKAFYSNAQMEDGTNPPHNNAKIEYGSSMIHNLPVLTAKDMEEITSKEVTAILPGYQYVWNIHSTEHCHMFHTILAKETPRFFACLSKYDVLSDGPRYATLMRITDHRFQDDDGRIVLAVQAMDRLRVVDLTSPYMPIQRGDFQIWPEIELIREKLNGAFPDDHVVCDGVEEEDCNIKTVDPTGVSQAALAASAAESYRCRKFEYAPVFLTEKPKGPDDAHSLHSSPNDSKATQMIKAGIRKQQNEESKYETDYLSVIELVNYDAIAYRSLIDAAAVNAQAIKNFWTIQESDQEQQMIEEEELFASLSKPILGSKDASFTIDSTQGDDFLPDFSTFANAPSNEGVAMMEYHLWKSLDELIRLLNKVSTTPVPLSSQLMALLPKRNDWPQEFVLDEYSKSMLSQTGPIVRVDDITKQSRSAVYDSSGYSSLRRALRLSNSVWLLLDGLAVTGADPQPPSRAEVLAMKSIFERLNVAKQVLDGVNEVLRRLIPHIKKDEKNDGKEK